MSRFVLINPRVRQNAVTAILEAPDGYTVTISEPKRSLDQNAFFHAICSDIARSSVKWAGERRAAHQWKSLLISGHAVAVGEKGEVVPGLEGEFVSIRESSARMGVKRAASLIEYSLAFCATHDIVLTDTRRQGFLR